MAVQPGSVDEFLIQGGCSDCKHVPNGSPREFASSCLYEGSGLSTLSRFYYYDDGTPVPREELASITQQVYQMEDKQLVHDVQLDLSDTFFDILQLDDSWTRDDIGYNFRTELNASLFVGASFFRVLHTVLLNDGTKIILSPLDLQVVRVAPTM